MDNLKKLEKQLEKVKKVHINAGNEVLELEDKINEAYRRKIATEWKKDFYFSCLDPESDMPREADTEYFHVLGVKLTKGDVDILVESFSFNRGQGRNSKECDIFLRVQRFSLDKLESLKGGGYDFKQLTRDEYLAVAGEIKKEVTRILPY